LVRRVFEKRRRAGGAIGRWKCLFRAVSAALQLFPRFLERQNRLLRIGRLFSIKTPLVRCSYRRGRQNNERHEHHQNDRAKVMLILPHHPGRNQPGSEKQDKPETNRRNDNGSGKRQDESPAIGVLSGMERFVDFHASQSVTEPIAGQATRNGKPNKKL